jgi:hypothetical protein
MTKSLLAALVLGAAVSSLGASAVAAAPFRPIPAIEAAPVATLVASGVATPIPPTSQARSDSVGWSRTSLVSTRTRVPRPYRYQAIVLSMGLLAGLIAAAMATD